MGTNIITPERLRELLSYDERTGFFHWKVAKKKRQLGTPIGSGRRPGTYVRIAVDDERHYAHRLVWLYVYGRWPTLDIDHINGDRGDNRLANLREATASNNLANRGPQRDNRSGLKGVHQHSNGRWRAQIGVRNQNVHIGLFDTPEEAAKAYNVAAAKYFGEFARTSPATGVG